jgi:hypothetical protein
LLQEGFTTRELHELEYLENDQVLKFLPGGKRWLQRNKREDVVDYLQAWATLLEAEQVFAELASNVDHRQSVIQA